MRIYSLLLLIATILTISCTTSDQSTPTIQQITSNTDTMPNNGIITKTSQHSFDDTYDKLRGIIDGNPNLKILMELDHQANAGKVDLTLPPTKIIMFGNPRLGTPLMLAGDLTGLDLPQKILVTERDGVVSLSYNDPAYLKDRHNIDGADEVLQKVTGALDKITTAAGS